MTQREREQEARRHLYRYAQDRREIEEYEQSVFGSPKHDESGIRGSGISDPTARLGVALAEPPQRLEHKRRWIAAIDDALDELRQTDVDAHGLAYICTRIYGLDGRRHKRRENRDASIKVALDCHLSVRALYYRLGIITNVVIAHAADHGCFEEKK